MERQLALIETTPEWQLDDRTREIGRRGVAQARAALQAAISRHDRQRERSERSAA